MFTGERIVPVKFDLRVNHTLIRDQFLWELNNFESDIEEFAKTLCVVLGVHDPEVGPTIAFAIREQLYEVAAQVLQETAIGKNWASDKLSGARRLRDAIILGYQLQRAPGRDLAIPEWYANVQTELQIGSPTSPRSEIDKRSSVMNSCIEDFDTLHGDLHGLSDAMTFLKSLVELDSAYDSDKATDKQQMRERKAVAGLFNWELPIREACHVAVQRNKPSKNRLWKNALARQEAKGQNSIPVQQIVSYGSELSNRSPTFDMDLSDFMDGDHPMSYEKAKLNFSQDPSQKWAAYVAGVILVLMTELGVRFEGSTHMYWRVWLKIEMTSILLRMFMSLILLQAFAM